MGLHGSRGEEMTLLAVIVMLEQEVVDLLMNRTAM